MAAVVGEYMCRSPAASTTPGDAHYAVHRSNRVFFFPPLTPQIVQSLHYVAFKAANITHKFCC